MEEELECNEVVVFVVAEVGCVGVDVVHPCFSVLPAIVSQLLK